MIINDVVILEGSAPEGLHTITVQPSNPDGGSVSGGGMASEGMNVIVSASSKDRYQFKGWQEDGETVSEDAAYSFPVTRDRDLVAMIEDIPSRLPDGYTEVEYVQGSSNSTSSYRPFISIPYVAGITKLEFEFSSTGINQNTNYQWMMGADSSRGSGNSVGWYGFGCRSGKLCYQYGVPSNAAYNTNLIQAVAGQKYHITIDSDVNKVTVDDNVYSGPGKGFWPFISSLYPFYVFNVNKLGSYAGGMYNYIMYPVTIYSFKMYDTNGELLRDLVPCKNPEGAVGFYDVVQNVFFGNANTSSLSEAFIAGPAV